MTCDAEVPFEVHAHDSVPLGLARVREHAIEHEARVVHDGIELAKGVDRAAHQLFCAREVSDIGRARDRLTAALGSPPRPLAPDRSSDLLRSAKYRGRLRSPVLLSRQLERVLAPDAASSARNDDDPTFALTCHAPH